MRGCSIARERWEKHLPTKPSSTQQQTAHWLANPALEARGLPTHPPALSGHSSTDPSATTTPWHPKTGFPRGSGGARTRQPAKYFAI